MRLKIFASALIALVLLVSTSASASMTLPEFVTKANGTATGGAAKLAASGVETVCKSGTESDTMEASKKSGTFSIDFKECSSPVTGTECHSEGDAAGIILVEGTWHLVLTTVSATDKHLIWYLVKELVIKCGTVGITIKGNVLGEITPANKVTKIYEAKVQTTVAGGTTQQEYTSFENSNGEQVSASLLAAAALGFHRAVMFSIWIIIIVQNSLIIN